MYRAPGPTSLPRERGPGLPNLPPRPRAPPIPPRVAGTGKPRGPDEWYPVRPFGGDGVGKGARGRERVGLPPPKREGEHRALARPRHPAEPLGSLRYLLAGAR